jgi:hypothetical protein
MVHTAADAPFWSVTRVCDAVLGALVPNISFAWARGIKLTALISYPSCRRLSRAAGLDGFCLGCSWLREHTSESYKDKDMVIHEFYSLVLNCAPLRDSCSGIPR